MPIDNTLHAAVKTGSVEQVEIALRTEDMNSKGEYERTAFILCAISGATDIVKLLLSKGADANISDVSTNLNFAMIDIISSSHSPYIYLI